MTGGELVHDRGSGAKLKRYQERLRALASRLVLAEDDQRHRIAADLHDNVVQTLLFARMKLEAARKEAMPSDAAATMAEVQKAVEQALAETRALLLDLCPPVLHDRGFAAGVEWLAQKAAAQHGFAVTFEDDGREKSFDREVRIVLFRAVRELLVNVAKHACARKVKVALRQEGAGVQVEVRDNGVGFDAAGLHAMDDASGGFGLFDIRERLDYFGGRMEILSQLGGGTQITLWAPLKQVPRNQ